MDFQKATRRYAKLEIQRREGQITQARFAREVEKLRFRDNRGVWWQIDPQSGSWRKSDGSAGSLAPHPSSARTKDTTPPIHQRPQIWWDVVSVSGGIIAGLIWLGYSSVIDPDPFTAVIIATLPIGFIILRKPLDAILRPLQIIRQRIPPLVLIGVGVAVPYFTAWFIYNFFYNGNTMYYEYQYLRFSIVAGSLIAYLILRIPASR